MYRCLCCNYKTLPKEPKECIAYGWPVCYWENDAFMKDMYDVNEKSENNRGMTLQEGKDNFKRYGACMEKFIQCVIELIEQFRSLEFSGLYTERYVDRLVKYPENFFTKLIAVGTLCDGDVHSMALQYTCPIITLLSVCDRQPKKESQVMEQIEAHVRQFWAVTRPAK